MQPSSAEDLQETTVQVGETLLDRVAYESVIVNFCSRDRLTGSKGINAILNERAISPGMCRLKNMVFRM